MYIKGSPKNATKIQLIYEIRKRRKMDAAKASIHLYNCLKKQKLKLHLGKFNTSTHPIISPPFK